ncbi:unnamed protein product [marine sediment metagenome]|uniref:DUF4325 domain-containing protein n=1 Tax=marine sediment metagenome TaxID=412755 RepID=X1CPJ4_9ZZZZ
MWGLFNIVLQNGGYFSIISGKGGLVFANGGKTTKTFKDIIILNKHNQATTISFHLDLNKEVSVEKAIKGYELVDMHIEELMGDFGEIIYKISEVGSGTGTRESGAQMKNELINIYTKTKRRIIIDFENIGIISSSFADELIGKLIDEIGFYQFQSIFFLVNMNKKIQTIFDASLKKRLSENTG